MSKSEPIQRIQRGKIESSYGKIVPSILEQVIKKDNENISFSFKYLDINHPEFSPAKCQKGYTAKFLDRLRILNDSSLGSFIEEDNRSLRSNPINWNKVFPKYKDGFPLSDIQLKSHAKDNSWEFAVTVNKHGRVHGFIIDHVSTFYIVWIDPDHLLFPMDKQQKNKRGKK